MNPSCRQATLASSISNPSAHTVPHWLLMKISKRPAVRFSVRPVCDINLMSLPVSNGLVYVSLLQTFVIFCSSSSSNYVIWQVKLITTKKALIVKRKTVSSNCRHTFPKMKNYRSFKETLLYRRKTETIN